MIVVLRCARARARATANARHAGDGVAIAADPPVCLHPAPFLSRSFRRARAPTARSR